MQRILGRGENLRTPHGIARLWPWSGKAPHRDIDRALVVRPQWSFQPVYGLSGASLEAVSSVACGVFIGKHACRPGSNGDTGMTAFYNSPAWSGYSPVVYYIICFY